MRRNTTPTQVLIVDGIDLTEATEVWVTYKTNTRKMTIKDPVVTYTGGETTEQGTTEGHTTIEVTLTETQTASLSAGTARVQVNFVLGGKHCATDIASFPVPDNLLEERMLDG